MRVRNATRGAVLADAARCATSAYTRMVGLLGSKDAGGGLFIEPCTSIHTLFMGYSIDVLFLDREDRVVALFPALRPWRFTPWVRAARRVLELDAGRAGDTAVGDQLECTPCG